MAYVHKEKSLTATYLILNSPAYNKSNWGGGGVYFLKNPRLTLDYTGLQNGFGHWL